MDTKEQLSDKIAQWKAEHINPYNKVEILWFGTLEAWKEEQGDLRKQLIREL